ncbi:GH116 family glycosyl hydrolase [Muricauda sp. SCSIO 64092]|uniref:GH116 family glycosyl-hydrolase n=1 Tax=Allomuricauda sp. SCSIO 64092 TaxID=2908842 RepID=UPI001FF58968|nr:GH116 family glycosyl-hydrolase [Muricauda sp. SCSIO 64092]UOY04946.1 GH116 family glycosyl hydrolase [Muricauda sp. SCSIO 64092]
MKKKLMFTTIVFYGFFLSAISQSVGGGIYSNEGSEYIGMPVGGICTGNVYLSGDGRLWDWDIFNTTELVYGGSGGDKFYRAPMKSTDRKKHHLEQGFAIRTTVKGKSQVRTLDQKGFEHITFRGEYPIGKVIYQDKNAPVSVKLEAFSPFIPTDDVNSGLPAVVMEYEITNTTKRTITLEIGGWLQNVVNHYSSNKQKGQLVNTVHKEDSFIRLSAGSEGENFEDLPDWGSMALTLESKGKGNANVGKFKAKDLSQVFESGETKAGATNGEQLLGTISTSFTLAKRESKKVRFIISWYFPNIHRLNTFRAPETLWADYGSLRHFYSKFFKNADGVADYILKNRELIENTKLWNKTWYDSSLPVSFLDRTFVNVSTLATTSSARFTSKNLLVPYNEGRFYAFEGAYLGFGTCTHVFHYEQAMGRVFPKLARDLREKVDLGLSFDKDRGIIRYRGEFSKFGHHDGRGHAIDGHAGTILRIYREHLMAPDYGFLEYNWPKIKLAIQAMIDQDKEKTGEADGILEGIQYNTLDKIWYGKISWISGLYAAVLKAGSEMAIEVEDEAFAMECTQVAALAKKNISSELFNGEYFIQKVDPGDPLAVNSNQGCHSDQLLGQYWASQVGLGDVLEKDKIISALKSIYKYNYVENYGKYLDTAIVKVKRHYAQSDEPGLIMCTFPKGGAKASYGNARTRWDMLAVGYFSEVWTAQEHQVAANMIDYGMLDEALTLQNAVNHRYAPQKRNPYNEIEYGNHYTRAMSGYAPFVSASGFYFHGPKGIIGFDPKIGSENFKSAFIVAEGWGSYRQQADQDVKTAEIELKYGQLKVSRWQLPSGWVQDTFMVTLDGKPVEIKKEQEKGKTYLVFDEVLLNAGQELKIEKR